MINELLVWFKDLIGHNFWLAPVFAFMAGVLTAFTPCSLSSVPLVVAYVGGASPGSSKTSLKYSVAYSLGMALTFTTLGVVASLAGHMVRSTGSWWYVLLGILMILMALQTLGIITIIPGATLSGASKKRGTIGAFVTGVLGGFFSSPCSTPVLVVLLALAAEQGTVVMGALLLVVYSLGHSVLAIAAGCSVGFVQKVTTFQRATRSATVLNMALALAMILLGFYMFYLGF